MNRKISWSARAVSDYKNILRYISTTWSSKEVVKFNELVTEALNNIKRNPEIAVMSKKKNVRRFVLSKQTSIYYRIQKEEVFVIALADNRQDPKKLKV